MSPNNLRFIMNYPVCVAVENKYNDNDGAYDVGFMWDGVTLSTLKATNQYVPVGFTGVNASDCAKKQAAEWYRKNVKGERDGRLTFTGETWKVKRARGIKKGTPVKVIAVTTEYFNGHPTRDVATVNIVGDDEAIDYSIGVNCLDGFVEGNNPWWYD